MSQMVAGTKAHLPELQVKLADRSDEFDQIMRLRYECFVEELGNHQMSNHRRLEEDSFDLWCDHLIVKDLSLDQVVGTYRLMPGERALVHGGFYSESFFDLTNFVPPKERTLELGRSCIAPTYRNGRVIQLLWEGIANYVNQHDYQYLIGCASMRGMDRIQLNRIHSLLQKHGYLTMRYGIRPLPEKCIDNLQLVEDVQGGVKELFRMLPPLIKGYLWLGAELAGEPIYDSRLNSIDYLVVLSTERVVDKYRRHFLER
ncbi:MAG TPA: GNAT family N-acyltransferase [Candidatus Bathyarchaeia archaeon]|nr:GNAT family N-acyltransferase [Candidatus Bathyarchaeia archaeon]